MKIQYRGGGGMKKLIGVLFIISSTIFADIDDYFKKELSSKEEIVLKNEIIEIKKEIKTYTEEDVFDVFYSGYYKWNEFIKSNSEIKKELYFSNKDYSGKDLSFYDLSEMNFSNSKFIGTKLKEALLNNSNFSFSNFFKADLSRSNLSNSELIDVGLKKVNLYKADLSGTVINRGWKNEIKRKKVTNYKLIRWR